MSKAVPESVKKEVRSVLLSKIGGVKLRQFTKDYKQLVGQHISWKTYGFLNILDFFKAIPEVARVDICDKDGELHVYGLSDDHMFMNVTARKAEYKPKHDSANGISCEKQSAALRKVLEKEPSDPQDRLSFLINRLTPNNCGLWSVCFKKLPTTTRQVLHDEFSEFGEVQELTILTSYVFLRFNNKESCIKALSSSLSKKYHFDVPHERMHAKRIYKMNDGNTSTQDTAAPPGSVRVYVGNLPLHYTKVSKYISVMPNQDAVTAFFSSKQLFPLGFAEQISAKQILPSNLKELSFIKDEVFRLISFQEIIDALSQFLKNYPVKDLHMPTSTGTNSKFAFVTLPTKSEAQRLINDMDKEKVGRNKIKLEISYQHETMLTYDKGTEILDKLAGRESEPAVVNLAKVDRANFVTSSQENNLACAGRLNDANKHADTENHAAVVNLAKVDDHDIYAEMPPLEDILDYIDDDIDDDLDELLSNGDVSPEKGGLKSGNVVEELVEKYPHLVNNKNNNRTDKLCNSGSISSSAENNQENMNPPPLEDDIECIRLQTVDGSVRKAPGHYKGTVNTSQRTASPVSQSGSSTGRPGPAVSPTINPHRPPFNPQHRHPSHYQGRGQRPPLLPPPGVPLHLPPPPYMPYGPPPGPPPPGMYRNAPFPPYRDAPPRAMQHNHRSPGQPRPPFQSRYPRGDVNYTPDYAPGGHPANRNYNEQNQYYQNDHLTNNNYKENHSGNFNESGSVCEEQGYGEDENEEIPGYKLFVCNFPYGTRYFDLLELFKPYGAFYVRVMNTHNMAVRSKALIFFKTLEEADYAMSETCGIMFNNRILTVMFDYHNNDGYLENKFLQNRMKDIKITAGTDTGKRTVVLQNKSQNIATEHHSLENSTVSKLSSTPLKHNQNSHVQNNDNYSPVHSSPVITYVNIAERGLDGKQAVSLQTQELAGTVEKDSGDRKDTSDHKSTSESASPTPKQTTTPDKPQKQSTEKVNQPDQNEKDKLISLRKKAAGGKSLSCKTGIDTSQTVSPSKPSMGSLETMVEDYEDMLKQTCRKAGRIGKSDMVGHFSVLPTVLLPGSFFWGQLLVECTVDSLHRLHELQSKMEKAAKQPCPKVEVRVAAKFEGVLYRAWVKRRDNKHATVLFIDFGNMETVLNSEIFYLPENFWQLPPMARPMKVIGAAPGDLKTDTLVSVTLSQTQPPGEVPLYLQKVKG